MAHMSRRLTYISSAIAAETARRFCFIDAKSPLNIPAHWISRNRGAKESANGAVWDAEYDVMEVKPATTAGAVALRRFVAGLMEGLFPDDDEHEHYVEAIRNAADFFEGGTPA